MKHTDFANIALKVLGTFWFVQALAYFLRGALLPFFGIDQMQGGFNWRLQVGSTFLFGTLYLGASLALMMKTEALLRLIKIDTKGASSGEQPASPDSYRPLIFSTLGIYFAVPAVGGIIYDVIKLTSLSIGMASSAYQMFQQSFLWEVLPSLGENIVKLAIGLVLAAVNLYPEEMKSMWKKLRPLSDDESEENRK